MSGDYYKIGLDTSELKRNAEEAKKLFSSIGSTANVESAKIDNVIKRIGKTAVAEGQQFDDMLRTVGRGVATYLTGRELVQFGKQIISVRGEFQGLQLAFETMLGSKRKADKMMSEVVDLAAKTPYTLTEVATNTKQLMAMGIASEDVMGTMKSLGDVAAGLSVPMSRLAINYGQVATLGKLQSRELRDFAMAGVPLIDELADAYGRTKSEIQEMVSAGKIGFADVEAAFISMSGEGGKFADMMEKRNSTVTGQISNLQDKIEVMMNSIGKANEGLIYKGISGAANLVENYQEVLKVLKVLIATYGTYKAATIVHALLAEAEAAGSLARALKQTAMAQSLLNAAQKASPVGLALAGITALIGGYVLWNEHLKNTNSFSQDLTKTISTEIFKLSSLFSKIKETTKGTQERSDAIKIANDRYGGYLGNLLTEKSSLEEIEKAQKKATNALIANISVQKSKSKLTKVLGKMSEEFDDSFGDFIGKFGETYGTDRIPEFVQAINDAVDDKIKDGGGKVERGVLEYSNIAKTVYDKFVKEISQKTGFLKYGFDDFQESFLDFAEFKADKSGFVKQLEGMIAAYQKMINPDGDDENPDRDDKYRDKDKKIKEQQEEITAQSDLNKKKIDAQSALNKAIVNLMNEGIEKQKALRRQAYNDQLADIDKQGQDYLDSLNKKNGKKSTDKGYATSLSDYVGNNTDDTESSDYYNNLQKQRLVADQQYVKDSEKIEQ